jgi:hypothetical protein
VPPPKSGPASNACCWRLGCRPTTTNGRAGWPARAALGQPAGGDSRARLIEVLRAEARLCEEGLSPHTALPLYEQLLQLDPDDVEAIAGKARS